ncbi:MAG: CrcB family protein [Actinobacteria bacterium]|nr:CrcB family protein [Actinomycetota bacterium]
MSLGRDLAAVVVGGLVGTGLRIAIDAALPHSDSTFPLSTLIINCVGAFVLGALVARLWRTAPSWLKAGLGVGVLGSFTTFSAFAVSLVSLTEAGEGMTALGYLALTLVLGLGAAWLGLALGSRAPVAPEFEE